MQDWPLDGADTVRLAEYEYGRYLRWLSEHGLLDPNTRPIDRAGKEQVRAFFNDYRTGRAPSTVALAIRGIAYVVRATHPPDGLPWLTKMAHAMANRAEPVKSKTARMATIAELLNLGRELMKEGRIDLSREHRSGAQVFRDGLMLSALATRPLRRRNLAALQIGKTLVMDAQGVRVIFKEKETKTGATIDWAYPHFLRTDFILYLSNARPILRARATEPDDGYLWVGRRGNRMDAEELTQRISVVTKARLGRRISPHLFRDCVATDIAIHAPEHVGITMPVLGHATLATSQKYYNQASSFHAAQRLQTIVAGLRGEGTKD